MLDGAVYKTARFRIPFTIGGQPEWKIAGELYDIVGLGKDVHPLDDLHMIRGFVVLSTRSNETPEAVVEEMLADTSLESVEVVGEVEVAGYPATQLSSEVTGEGDRFVQISSIRATEIPFGTFVGVVQRWYVVDVAGKTAVVWIEAPPDQFDEWIVEAEAALATLEFLAE